MLEKIKNLIWKIQVELNPHRLSHRKALRFCKKHFNELGVCGGRKIARLIGFGEGDDYYYLLRYIGEFNFKKSEYENKDVYSSMVIGWCSIKGMSKADYKYTDINSAIKKSDRFIETYWEDE